MLKNVFLYTDMGRHGLSFSKIVKILFVGGAATHCAEWMNGKWIKRKYNKT